MATEASLEIPPLAAPPTFSETINFYFATENALYEERLREAIRVAATRRRLMNDREMDAAAERTIFSRRHVLQ